MDKLVIQKLQSQFDTLAHNVPGEDIEFWFARELQEPLGYARWENFKTAIQRAIESCKTTGYDADDHFRGVTKMVPLTIAAKNLATEMTNHNVQEDDLHGENAITREHVQNNTSVREMLGKRGIQPERLPPEEDLKKLERRVKSDEKKLAKQSGKLPGSKD